MSGIALNLVGISERTLRLRRGFFWVGGLA